MGEFAHAVMPRPTALQRNLLLDLSAATGIGASVAVVGALLPSVARQGGMDSMGLATLAALPFLASLIGLLAGRIGPQTPGRLAVFRAAASAGLLLVIVAPHPLLIALTVFGFWTAMSLGAPMQQRLWASMYPRSERGRLIGIVGSGRSAAAMVALLVFSFAASDAGWLRIVSLVVVVGVVAAMATSRLSLPPGDVAPSYGPRESIATVLRRPMLRRITAAQIVFGSGMVAAPALIAMVQIDRLGLGIEDVALAGLVGYAATTVMFGIWGRIASRTGALVTMTSGTLLGVVSIGLMAIAPDFTAVLAASILLGITGAAIDVSWPLLIADHAAHEEQAAAAAGLGAIMGLRGLIMPFVIVAPIQLGLMDETGGLLLCVLATASGALLYLRLLGARLSSLRRMPGLGAATVRRMTSPGVARARVVFQWSPARALMPASSSSGWPDIRRSRLMRSTMAGWVLKRPLALLSSFFTGLTT